MNERTYTQKQVFVAIAHPKDSWLSPYVFGVFDCDDDAHDRFNSQNLHVHAVLKVNAETYLQRSE